MIIWGNNKKIKKVLSALLAAVLLLTEPMFFSEAFAGSPDLSERTYNVGSNRLFGSFLAPETYSGAAYDYLSIASKFTKDNYVFSADTPTSLFRQLRGASIDIIPCVTEKELEIYGQNSGIMLTKQPLLPKFSAIYINTEGNSANVNYGDIDALSKLEIGYLSEERPQFFDKDGKFIFDGFENTVFHSYPDETSFYNAFSSGIVGAVIKDSFRAWDKEKIALRSDLEPTYFAVRSFDQQLADKLDSAVAEINMQYSSLSSELYCKYVLRSGFQTHAYSPEAAKYLETHDAITIGFNTGSEMINIYNSKTGKLEGIPGNIIDMLFENIGLNYSIVALNSRSECIRALEHGEVDLIYGGISSLNLLYDGLNSTSPIIRQPIAFFGLPGTEISNSPKIAITNENEEIRHCIETYYQTAEITLLATDADAIKAVKDKTFDFMCTGCYNALALQGNGNSELSIIKVLNSYVGESFGYRDTDSALCEVIETGLSSLNNNGAVFGKYDFISFSQSINAHAKQGHNRDILLWILIATLGAVGIIVIIRTNFRTHTDVDPITGGRNKERFFADSQKAIKKSDLSKWMIVVFDIDKFKYINEHLGYEEGDNMLRRLYKVVQNNLESNEICARTNNDNFALTVHNTEKQDIERRLNKIFSDFEEINSHFVTYPVLFSAGACRLDLCQGKYGMVNFNFAIDRCNIAKKSIKNMHTNEIAFYDGVIRQKALREKDYENAMPQALKDGEFLCYLQPKYGSKSRHIEGAEALIRWNSKEFGFVGPNNFIPIAEKNGFVTELDFFILEEVCKAMRRWLDAGLTPVVVSVNQSRMHLNHEDYIFKLRELVDRYEIPYQYLELELTESVFTENADLMLNVMQKLHDVGFQLSIDDFGSGYSSLNMLKDIPADVVKIDREFFSGTVNSYKGRMVISSVVDLAKALDMKVISEGVETLDQVEFLEDIECQLIQGFYFSKPIPIPDFERLWEKDRNQSQP